MSFQCCTGDILQIYFTGMVDGGIKKRRVIYWMEHPSDDDKVLVTGIYGTKTEIDWEFPISPGLHNGLDKPSVIRLPDTVYVLKSSIISKMGTLNELERYAVTELMESYSRSVKDNSPDDFGEGTFEIFE